MVFDWDADKAEANLAKHGVAFEAVEDFDISTAVEVVDSRVAYGEERRRAIGFIGHRLHVLIFTRRGSRTRVISLRRANARERRVYDQAKAS
ncbi:MAG: BrnT family toxin [Inquilinus limosus]|uniref:BrnT family toxin n=1 Tax=Inquilinus limosus TaxID=171674 RepID=A0A952KGC8_9PROT|nr:BrnT family toxin [Inquilinus limosus]